MEQRFDVNISVKTENEAHLMRDLLHRYSQGVKSAYIFDRTETYPFRFIMEGSVTEISGIISMLEQQGADWRCDRFFLKEESV